MKGYFGTGPQASMELRCLGCQAVSSRTRSGTWRTISPRFARPRKQRMTDERWTSGLTSESRIETDEKQRYENPMRLARRCCCVRHSNVWTLAYRCSSRRHFSVSISDRYGEV